MNKVSSFPGIQIPLVLILSLPNESLFCFLQQAFDQNLHMVGTFATCEQFWSLYSHLIRPGDLQSHSDFHIFKRGIKPLWEVLISHLNTVRIWIPDIRLPNLFNYSGDLNFFSCTFRNDLNKKHLNNGHLNTETSEKQTFTSPVFRQPFEY